MEKNYIVPESTLYELIRKARFFELHIEMRVPMNINVCNEYQRWKINKGPEKKMDRFLFLGDELADMIHHAKEQ